MTIKSISFPDAFAGRDSGSAEKCAKGRVVFESVEPGRDGRFAAVARPQAMAAVSRRPGRGRQGRLLRSDHGERIPDDRRGVRRRRSG